VPRFAVIAACEIASVQPLPTTPGPAMPWTVTSRKLSAALMQRMPKLAPPPPCTVT
jgi:hypothetical protein